MNDRPWTQGIKGKTIMTHEIVTKLGFWWPKMRDWILEYVLGCNTCQHIKPGVFNKCKRAQKQKLFAAEYPFEQTSVDIVGPLPVGASEN